MQGRNKLTIVLTMMILSGVLIGTLITIRDYDLIISDFQDFVNNPLDWDDPNMEGNLNLYIEGLISENDSETTNLVGKTLSQQHLISHLYLTLTHMQILEVEEDIPTDLILNNRVIDLLDINNTINLFDSFTLQSGNYSVLHVYFERQIIASTYEGNITLTAQGSGFFTIPFYSNNYNKVVSNLEINEDEESNLLLVFQMQIIWNLFMIVPVITAYISF